MKLDYDIQHTDILWTFFFSNYIIGEREREREREREKEREREREGSKETQGGKRGIGGRMGAKKTLKKDPLKAQVAAINACQESLRHFIQVHNYCIYIVQRYVNKAGIGIYVPLFSFSSCFSYI